MINIEFEEALTIIDYHNPMLRVYNKYPEHQILGIANDIMKKNGLEWVFLTLAHEEKIQRIAKQSKLEKSKHPHTYNFVFWSEKRREENLKYEERCIQLQSQQNNSIKEKKYYHKNNSMQAVT